jgi:cytochrome c553
LTVPVAFGGDIEVPMDETQTDYIARQLYDMQSGHRAGRWMPLMATVVAGLSASDVLAAAAYLGSLRP